VDAFVGIDLAIAKRKRLPLALCVWEQDAVVPRRLAVADAPQPPRGEGNVAALDPARRAAYADEVVAHLHRLEEYFGVVIRRVAIDAPSAPRLGTLRRRRAEEALDAEGINYFTTPSAAEFEVIRDKVHHHLRGGGAEARLPHANQLWMLVGFSLFERLRKGEDWELLEVFPQATACALGAGSVPKRKAEGVRAQLAAAARLTGWPYPFTVEALGSVAYGPRHDRLDAYLSAWAAALPPERRVALGVPPDDAIWVPAVEPDIR
jgi:hypothetical protein